MSKFLRRRLPPALVLFVALWMAAPVVRAQEPAQTEHRESRTTAGQQSTPAAQSEEANEAERDENAAYLHSASVKWIGAKLGLSTEAAATAFQVANFVVLAIAIGGLLIKKMPVIFRKRNSDIQKHLVDARTATEEASARLNSVEERLGKLDGQIAAMRAQAEKDAAAEEQRIRASAEEEKKKILAAAEQEIAAATTHAQRQLQQYAAELAIEQAARKLAVSAETDRLLVQNFARQLTENSKDGQN